VIARLLFSGGLTRGQASREAFSSPLPHLYFPSLSFFSPPPTLPVLYPFLSSYLSSDLPRRLLSLRQTLSDAMQRLCFASRHQLIVPRHRRTSFGRRAFTVTGPTAWKWNSLPYYLRDPSLSENTFRRSLRHNCLRCTSAGSALEALRNALYNFFTYLLTYLSLLSPSSSLFCPSPRFLPRSAPKSS